MFDATPCCLNNWGGWDTYRNLDGLRILAVKMNIAEGFFIITADEQRHEGKMGDFLVFNFEDGQRSVWNPTDFHNNHSSELKNG